MSRPGLGEEGGNAAVSVLQLRNVSKTYGQEPAVVQALGVRALAIGPEIDPGVPWTRSISGVDLALALKSGNFGAADFFLKAWSLLQ